MASEQQQPNAAPAPPTHPLIHNAALAGAVICPLVMLLPPRRMDWRFLILSTGFSMSTSQLAYDWTGRSIYDRVGGRFEKLFSSELPEGARETQRRLREERMRREGLTEEDLRRQEAEKRNALQRLWYGRESDEGWNRKRAEEHAKALEEGKGLSGIIMDQISEVMPGNKDSKEGKDGKKQDDEKKS